MADSPLDHFKWKHTFFLGNNNIYRHLKNFKLAEILGLQTFRKVERTLRNIIRRVKGVTTSPARPYLIE